MLLIHCPYCDETLPELEFAYAGEAHIARPADPSALSDEEWRDFLFIRTNARGTHFERWRHSHGCGKWFHAARCTASTSRWSGSTMSAPRPAPTAAAAASSPSARRTWWRVSVAGKMPSLPIRPSI